MLRGPGYLILCIIVQDQFLFSSGWSGFPLGVHSVELCVPVARAQQGLESVSSHPETRASSPNCFTQNLLSFFSFSLLLDTFVLKIVV